MSTLNKDEKILSSTVENEDESKNRFLLLLTKIPPDVLLALSIAVYLHDNPQRVTDANDVSTNETLVTHSDRHNDDIAYSTFCELFDDAYGNRDVMEICKETYWSQIPRVGKIFKDSIVTFFRLISDQMNEDHDKDEIRTSHLKKIIEENESYKVEIKSLVDQMEKMTTDYNEKIQELENEKQIYETQVTNAYQSANMLKVQIQQKNKHDALMNLMNSENKLDDFEKVAEEKRNRFVIEKKNNNIETDQLKRELLRKSLLLQMINNRFSNDMLIRYKKKKNLQQSIESKTKLVGAMQEKLKSMEIYLKNLEEDEKVYLKRELYDKLDAIKEKIALRAISKFLVPYVIRKFGPKKTKNSKKKKNKKTKTK